MERMDRRTDGRMETYALLSTSLYKIFWVLSFACLLAEARILYTKAKESWNMHLGCAPSQIICTMCPAHLEIPWYMFCPNAFACVLKLFIQKCFALFFITTAHPRIRLFVSHGGLNSIMEAIQHGVPIVGLPIFADQPPNMVRVEAKKFGVYIHFKQIKAETLALRMKQVIEDKRYAALWACGHIG